jgi:hypothetical protein
LTSLCLYTISYYYTLYTPPKRLAHTSTELNKANLLSFLIPLIHIRQYVYRGLRWSVPHRVVLPLLTYLEFGNYIGADLGSDDDEDDFDIAPATSAPSAPGPSGGNGSYAPLEGLEDEDEDMEEDNGMEMTLHGVDG